MTPLWKSTKDVDSHRGLEKPRKRRSAFPHFRTGPTAMDLSQQSILGGSILLDQGGSVLHCQKDFNVEFDIWNALEMVCQFVHVRRLNVALIGPGVHGNTLSTSHHDLFSGADYARYPYISRVPQ